MLNEIQEFEEYTCEIKKDMTKRLTYSNLSNGMSGVPRALLIIARYAIYNLRCGRKGTKDLLNAWCGFETDTFEEYMESNSKLFEKMKEMKGWLPNYITYLYNENSKEKELPKILKELKEKAGQYNKSVFKEIDTSNDENQIKFDKVIANAYEEGPLKNYVLVCKGNPFEGKKDIYKKKNINETDRTIALKTAAICLLQMKKHFCKKVNIGLPELSNWIGKGVQDKKKLSGKVTSIIYEINGKELPLIRKEYLDSYKNNVKYVLEQSWKDMICAEVVEQEKQEDYKKAGYDVYQDVGCTGPMVNMK